MEVILLQFSNSDPCAVFVYFVLIVVHGDKINMGPLPGEFVTCTVAFNFLGIALTVDMGIFRQVAIF